MIVLAPFASCSSEDAGIETHLVVPAIADAGTITFDDASTGTIVSGHVAIVAIELIHCDDEAHVLRWLAPEKAFAHGGGTSTQSGEPVVVQLVGGTELDLEALAPPPDAYCFVDITLGPPDSDAVGQPPGAPVEDSVSLTLDTGTEMTFSTTELATHRIAFAPELVLGEDDAGTTLEVHFDANAWLSGLTPTAIAADPSVLVTGAADALSVEVLPPADHP